MKDHLFFEFTVNKEANTILIQREFKAELTLVWDAWTNAEIIDRWWAPEGWECKTKSMEFKEGGLRLYLMRGPENEEHWGINTYEKIELHRGFTGKDCFTDENANVIEDYPNSNYQIEFMAKNNSTFIKHRTTYPSLDQLEASIQYGFEEGMTKALKGLDRVLKV